MARTTPTRRAPLRLVALVLCFALAAACGGSGDDTTPADDTTSATDTDATDTDASDIDAPADDGDATADPGTDDGDSTDGDDPTGGDDVGELTDSFRGVSADTIKIGVGLVDGSAFGFDPGDIAAKWEAAAAHHNEMGGVLGRQLEVIVETYSPVGTTEAEASCLVHTEDEEVFAFVGSMREDNILCYTEFHDTVAINNLAISDAQIERSRVLLVSASPPANAQLLDGLRQLGEEGYFDDRTVAITYDETSEPNLGSTRDLLGELGATVVGESLAAAPPGDVPANQAEYDVFLQRWESDGATAVVAMGVNAALGAVGAAARAGSDLDVLTTVTDLATYQRLGHQPDDVGGTVYGFASQDVTDMYNAGTNGVKDCVDRFEAASGETVVVDAGPDDLTNFAPTVGACRAVDMFVAIATAAGPDLTTDSFTEAALSLGEFTMTGTEGASLGENKLSADDTPVVVNVYDRDAADFLPRR